MKIQRNQQRRERRPPASRARRVKLGHGVPANAAQAGQSRPRFHRFASGNRIARGKQLKLKSRDARPTARLHSGVGYASKTRDLGALTDVHNSPRIKLVLSAPQE